MSGSVQMTAPGFAFINSGPASGLLASGTLLSGWSPASGWSPSFGPSGAVSSGSIPPYSSYAVSGMSYGHPIVASSAIKCHRCGEDVGASSWDSPRVVVLKNDLWKDRQVYCLPCVGYREDLDRIETREDWIRETVPLRPDTPAWMLADWLEENSRQKDADYIRELANKAQRSGA